VSIPHYDPFDPDSFDPDNPDSVVTLDPSRLTAFNLDYAIIGSEEAELATTTAIDDWLDIGTRKGTLILFDTSMNSPGPTRLIVRREGDCLRTLWCKSDHDAGPSDGAVVFIFSPA
jgi:hypothetical protein